MQNTDWISLTFFTVIGGIMLLTTPWFIVVPLCLFALVAAMVICRIHKPKVNSVPDIGKLLVVVFLVAVGIVVIATCVRIYVVYGG